MRTEQAFDAVGHSIEIPRELSDLVASPIDGPTDPRRQITSAEILGRPSQRPHRRRQVTGEPQTECSDDERQQHESPPQGFRLQEVSGTGWSMECAHNDERSALWVRHRSCNQVETTSTGRLLDAAFCRPKRDIDGSFRGLTVHKFPTFQVKNEYLRAPPATPPVTPRGNLFRSRFGDPPRCAGDPLLGPIFRPLFPSTNTRSRLGKKGRRHHQNRAEHHHRHPEPEEDAEEEAFHQPPHPRRPDAGYWILDAGSTHRPHNA